MWKSAVTCGYEGGGLRGRRATRAAATRAAATRGRPRGGGHEAATKGAAHRSAHVLNALAAPYAPTRDTTRLAATLSRRRSATAEDHALNERCVWKLRRREATRVMASARASARALASDRHARNAISEILNAPRANILATRRRRERVSLV